MVVRVIDKNNKKTIPLNKIIQKNMCIQRKTQYIDKKGQAIYDGDIVLCEVDVYDTGYPDRYTIIVYTDKIIDFHTKEKYDISLVRHYFEKGYTLDSVPSQSVLNGYVVGNIVIGE